MDPSSPASNLNAVNVPFEIKIDEKTGILTLARPGEVDKQYHVVMEVEGKKSFINDAAQLKAIRDALIAFSSKHHVVYKELKETHLIDNGVRTDQIERVGNFFEMSGDPRYSSVIKDIFGKVMFEKASAEGQKSEGLDSKRVTTKVDESKMAPTTKKTEVVAKVALTAIADFFRRLGQRLANVVKWIWNHTIGILINKYYDYKDSKKKAVFDTEIVGKKSEEITPIASVEAERLHAEYFKSKKDISIKADEAKGLIIAPWSDIRKALTLAKRQFGALIKDDMSPEENKQFGHLVETILYGKPVSENGAFSLQPSEKATGPVIDDKHFFGGPLTSLLTKYCFSDHKKVADLNDVEMLKKALLDSLVSFGKDYDRTSHCLAGVVIKDDEGKKGSGFKKMLNAYKDTLLKQEEVNLQEKLDKLKKSQFFELLSKTFSESGVPEDWFEKLLGRADGYHFEELKTYILEDTKLGDREKQELEKSKGVLVEQLLQLKALEWIVLMNQRAQFAYVSHYSFDLIKKDLIGAGGSPIYNVFQNLETFESRVDDIKIISSGLVYALFDYSVQMPSPWENVGEDYQSKEGWSNLRLDWSAPDDVIEKIQSLTIRS